MTDGRPSFLGKVACLFTNQRPSYWMLFPFFSRAMPTQHSLASGSHLPLGIPPFLMPSEGSGQLPPNPVSGLIPNLPPFPTTSLPPPPRSASETTRLKEALRKIFPTPEQREKIEEILAQHPHMRDMNALSALVLDLSWWTKNLPPKTKTLFSFAVWIVNVKRDASELKSGHLWIVKNLNPFV